ncbi:YrzI family protein [Bacillus pseudomycoides]|uniref:YrzI family protein n=1 Tax=Bacillus pseudomycoides TaxID=64104 RepID=A0AA91VCN3_9BACI|nr:MULTISPECIES: YrzI family small protein [Bacillus]PEB50467.1 YrzI family protein [Bacillus sp. AFS098217]PED82203.1 YrzI family protein [Bacillus pseudomycoides]PEU05703.1 YrzI family protein [Bacillus sp. AFS019443]PEU15530.1 YrzI family protein [Bacillus sp. AFS014408]PFW62022.1 YrzI family protein [Bacillus sp. AFS075034]
MKFRVFFLTITIQKNKLTEAEILQEQQIQKIMDEVKEHQVSYYNHMY